jgi:hypothetical protein
MDKRDDVGAEALRIVVVVLAILFAIAALQGELAKILAGRVG